MGYKIDQAGLHPTDEKLKAIKDSPCPGNVSQLKSYLGLVNYYGKFLPQLATCLAPLYDLLKRETDWHWGKSQEKAFADSKRWLHSERVLIHFDPNKPLVLFCDASPYGLGAVLCHKLSEGVDKPIAFASRTLSAAEKNYSHLEKEGLAVVFGVKRFYQYLFGQNFTIVTDHKPLLGLLGEKQAVPTMAAARIQRWAMFLAAYQYQLIYRPGAQNGNADALSRLPLKEMASTGEEDETPEEIILTLQKLATTPVKAAHICKLTGKDPILSRVRNLVIHGWAAREGTDKDLAPYYPRRAELSVIDGCLLWGSRVIIPPEAQKPILEELHDGHPGIVRMRSLARSYVWWPKMDSQIERTVQRCPSCQAHRKAPLEAPLHPWEWPDRPWARLHLD